ncbi:MAG: NAD(P)/FAD-dependent oxidoreductase [Chloroflexales bacterium]|nr:NAD(P)/FAD-dependent oxidoreductase [Chloroflexales bacterium]
MFDVAIIGSGIVGSTLGAILARRGLQVIMFEAKSHPRFSIGESMILETSETMRALAELYDVPELAYFSSENYFPYIGASHGVKRHFSYLHHTPGHTHQPLHSLQAVIPKHPHGHELHLYRQDVDYFLTTCAVHYGATVLQNTPVRDIAIDMQGVTVITAEGKQYAAAYLVDAGGFRSLVADKFNLRDFDLQTYSRAIFTHMIDVPDFHEVGTMQKEADLPFSVAEGTLHHVFAGGWLWVIPFNNHAASTNPLCSVGLMLDPRMHPPRNDLVAEEEFFTFIERFPSVAAQFRNARAVREWVRTGRIQYSSKQVVGDRWALLGHSAGFIDPLYSKGLYVSLSSVSILAHYLLQAHRDGDYSRERFLPLERATLAYLRSNDLLVAHSYKSWESYHLWRAYSVLWLLGAYTELVKLFSIRIQSTQNGKIDPHLFIEQLQQLKLAGGGFAEYDHLAAQIDAVVEAVDLDDAVHIAIAVDRIYALFQSIDWMPQPFYAILAGRTHLPKHKIRLDLLKREQGFLRSGAYRDHFFGKRSIIQIGRAFWDELRHYSKLTLALRRRRWLHHARRAYRRSVLTKLTHSGEAGR